VRHRISVTSRARDLVCIPWFRNLPAGLGGIGRLLQDLDAGQNLEDAIARFGFTFAEFEADLMKRVGVKPSQTASR